MNCDDVFTHIELEETKTYKKKKTDERSKGMEHKTRGRIPTPNPNHPQKKKMEMGNKTYKILSTLRYFFFLKKKTVMVLCEDLQI